MPDRTDDIIVGIDLGTTFSLVAYVDERGPHVIRDDRGDGRVPSVLGVRPGPDGGPLLSIGWEARNHAIENPRATVYSIKRLIGRGLDEIRNELPFLAYAVQSGPRDTIRIEIDEHAYSPEEISSLILRELKTRAERHLSTAVRRAVITVPAYFDDAQRQATRTAAELAGLEVVRMVNEPTAAALAYGIGVRESLNRMDEAGKRSPASSKICEAKREKSQDVAIYDLGGGTFDVSILRIEDGVFQVLATTGDTHLGGDDFDRTIITLVTSEIERQLGVRIDSPATRQALRSLAEAVKIRLSERENADLELDLGDGRVYRRSISRAEFESLLAPAVERTLALCDQALRDAGLSIGDLAQIILVGGSTRIPLVRRRIGEHFGRAAYTALNPDEVVAIGAAVQASILAKQRSDLLLLDVIPLSLGIETLGGAMGKLILRNSTIPCRRTEMFTTFLDGQTAIQIKVLQGERELAEHCRTLGEFTLRGIPPMPAGIPKVEVEFLVDANGILNVAAREQRSGVSASIQVIPSHGLTREEIEKAMQESIAFAREDVHAHRRIDLINQIEFDAHKTEQMLARFGGRLDDAERRRIEDEIAALRTLVRSEKDLDELHRALDRFGKSTLHLAEIGITETLKMS